MTVPQFSRPGAIDLSALANKPAAPAGGKGGGTGSYAFDVVGEQALRSEVIERSMSVVVLVSFWSEQAPASVEINATLTKLSDEFAGRFLLAKVDAGTQPDLAQALGIPGVPLVVAALRGQLAPLIQEALPEAEMRQLIQQILQAAAANGVSGVAEPVSAPAQPAGPAEDTAEPDAKFPAAEEALMSGDIDGAIKEYEAAIANTPGDDEATVGLARATLLKRTREVDAAKARQAAADKPNDIEAQTLVADLDLMGGHVDDAFSRLIDLVRRTSGADRDIVRTHLIEMFAVVGDADPRVGKARQMLASALF